MINVGIVGCGRIIEEGHAPAFSKLKDRFRIVAVADPSRERRDLIGQILNVPDGRRLADWNDLMALDDVSLIDMALPHFLHLESCVAAAKSGKAILMEKPMATSQDEASAIMAAVAGSDAPSCIVHNYLYRSAHAAALKLISEGAIGKPFLYRCSQFMSGHWPGVSAYDPDWRTKAAKAGGGALIDNAYHYLYLAASFMGSPVTNVYARTGTFVHDIEVEDTVLVTLGHGGNGVSSIEVGWSAAGAQEYEEIHGTEGSIALDRDGHPLGVLRADEWEFPEVLESDFWGYDGLFAAYADAIESGGEAPVPFSEGYQNIKVVMAAYESGRSGQSVEVG